MKLFIRYAVAVLISTIVTNASAQNAEMADTFRSEGKIYVVVAIILIVLAGLITYLFMLDRNLHKLEKMLEEKNKLNDR